MATLYQYKDDYQEVPKPKEIGVDSEILKTSMAIFQPIHRMQMDFLEDEFMRDRYLDSALTVRGIAIMTMGMLDKTVGAGLTAVQQQADQNNIQMLLKQISWTSKKMSDYDHAQVYRDTDEKVESCMEIALAGTSKAAKKQVDGKTLERVTFSCSETCGPPPEQRKKNDYRTQNGKKSGNGSYAYCVCCAEAETALNQLSEKGRQAEGLKGVEDPKKVYTLAERAWFGVGENDGADGVLTKNMKAFKAIYGDVVVTTEGAKGQASNGQEPHIAYLYQLPQAGIPELVGMFKDKCNYNPDLDNSIGNQGICKDLAQDFKVEFGVCPALFEIFKNWKSIISGQGSTQDIGKAWAEASMGHPLDGRIIKEFLAINGDPVTELPPGEEKATLSRVIDAYCEASAISALVRLHSRFASMTEDHLLLNRTLNTSEKQQLQTLVNRFGSYLALAEADTNSKYKAEASLAGVSIQFDRRMTGLLASTSQANLNWQNYVAQSSGYTAIGRASEYCDGGNCEGGSASSAGRQADPIDAVNVLNATRDQFDPVSASLRELEAERRGR